jgi:hypothetical protein
VHKTFRVATLTNTTPTTSYTTTANKMSAGDFLKVRGSAGLADVSFFAGRAACSCLQLHQQLICVLQGRFLARHHSWWYLQEVTWGPLHHAAPYVAG